MHAQLTFGNRVLSVYLFLTLDVVTQTGILFPKLFWPTVKKTIEQEKLLEFEAEGPEFAKLLRSLEQFIRILKGRHYF